MLAAPKARKLPSLPGPPGFTRSDPIRSDRSEARYRATNNSKVGPFGSLQSTGTAIVATSTRSLAGSQSNGAGSNDPGRMGSASPTPSAGSSAGPLTVGDLYEVFPFRNEVVVFEATGAELVQMAVRALHLLEKKQYQPLELGGVTLTWQRRMGAPEVVELRVGGEIVEPGRTYTVATNSYVAEQWEHHLTFEPRELRSTGKVVLEVAEAAVRAGPVVPPPDPRIVRVGAR